jgi:AcrR family transcriptional regulator
VREEAGVSTGAIYTYFPNKEAMMRALLERARDDRRRQLDATGGAVDPALVLLEWAGAIFGAEGQHAARIDVNLWAEALRNPRVKKLATGALKDATKAVAAVVASRLPASGALRTLDRESIASVLIAFFLGLEVQTAVGMPLDGGEIVRVLSTLFSDYLPERARPKGRAVRRGRRGSTRS